MRSMSYLIGDVTKEYLGKKGLVFSKLFQSWSQIVGEQKARMAFPEKISFAKASTHRKGHKTGAILTLSTQSSYATILQHEKNLWIEKINLFLGENVITDIKFSHSMPSPNKGSKMRRATHVKKLSKAQEKKIEQDLEHIVDEKLKESLKNFATSLYLDTNQY